MPPLSCGPAACVPASPFSRPRASADGGTMSFSSLPYEIQHDILRYAIDVQPAKHVLPCVNSTWRDITLPIIHSHIRLQSREQLHSFSHHVDVDEPEPKSTSSSGSGIKTRMTTTTTTTTTALECCAQGRTLEIRLPSGSFVYGVWQMIFKALKRCEHRQKLGYTLQWFNNHANNNNDNNTTGIPPPLPPRSCRQPNGCRGIKVLKFYFEAYNNDPGVVLLGAVLSQLRPEVFVWNSPSTTTNEQNDRNPNSISVVASLQLCKAIRTWDSLSVLDLSDITFPDDGRDFMTAVTNMGRLRSSESLREIITRQVNNSHSEEQEQGEDSHLIPTHHPHHHHHLEISLRRAVGFHEVAVVFTILGQPRLTRFYLEHVRPNNNNSATNRLPDVSESFVETMFLDLWDGTDMRELPERVKSYCLARVRRVVEAVTR